MAKRLLDRRRTAHIRLLHERCFAVTTLLFLLGGTSSVAVGSEPPTGQWKVTNLDGEIKFTTTGPPDGLCEIGTNIFRARDEDSFVRLVPLDPDGKAAGHAGDTVTRIVNDFSGVFDLSADNVPHVDTSRLFVFHFEFDNGLDVNDYEYELNYHSNEVLESDFDESQVAVRRDPSEQTAYLSTLPFGDALATLNASFGGIEGYVGTWLAEDGDPVLPGKSIRILGMEALQSGGGDTGKALFMVTGRFEDSRTMVGQWSYVEVSILFDCKSEATGQGSWEAEPD